MGTSVRFLASWSAILARSKRPRDMQRAAEGMVARMDMPPHARRGRTRAPLRMSMGMAILWCVAVLGLFATVELVPGVWTDRGR